jgi:membrane protease YdiL (CAAX protease family)
MTRESLLISLGLSVAAAFGLWYFAFQTDMWNFWLRLSLSAVLLAVSALVLTPDRRRLFQFRWRDVMVGVVSALVLYALFWLGKQIAPMLVPFAAAQITDVYASKEQLNIVWIGLLLLFLVGPSEEIFWRGFVQRRLADLFGHRTGLLTTTAIYALVHLWTLNSMLIAAAAIAGLFWGWLYGRGHSIVSVMVSHALWDVMIFVLLPLG